MRSACITHHSGGAVQLLCLTVRFKCAVSRSSRGRLTVVSRSSRGGAVQHLEPSAMRKTSSHSRRAAKAGGRLRSTAPCKC
eukprot:6442504-Prymnesium_polylepis.1